MVDGYQFVINILRNVVVSTYMTFKEMYENTFKYKVPLEKVRDLHAGISI